ncbi:MAG TPA: hypothetical protein VFA81_12905 [Burkholderiales bacterium]|nr:hypothetical protein [Burkholderiales bacterium]
MTPTINRHRQGGALLLEALIAILLFSLGILSLVGLQATAIANVSEAKYRADASFLTNQLIGQIWVNRTNIASYAYNGSGTTPSVLQGWVAEVTNALPGAADNLPTVTIGAGNQVTITVSWQRPEDSAKNLAPHSFTATTMINCC